MAVYVAGLIGLVIIVAMIGYTIYLDLKKVP